MSDVFAWGAGLFVFGAIIGSFLATIAVRWPEDRSVLRGRSECDHCHRPLTPRDLVPLLSALVSHGRCRTCGGAIHPRHWQVELGAALIGGVAGFAVAGPAAIAGAVFGWMLLVLAVLDLTELWLPDALTGTLAITGLAAAVVGVDPMMVDRLIGGAAGFGTLWLVATGYRLLRGREGLGGGDPKLFGAIGLWLGWRMLPVVLLLAALAGLGAVVFARATGREVRSDTRVPFGACLAVAAYPAWLAMIGFAA